MAKNIFQHVEIVDLTEQKIKVEAPVFEIEEAAPEISPEEVRLDNLMREAEAFKKSWTAEKERMIQQARDEAGSIKKEAENTARELVRTAAESADKDRQNAEAEAELTKTQAAEEAKRITAEAEAERDRVYAESLSAAHAEGREAGWEEGKAEVERLIDRLHGIINASIAKRREIIEDVETQLIDLVLLISRKVVKVISEKQKNIVIHNIVQALDKLKSRGEVAIRVNLADLQLATSHVKNFLNMVENVESIKVLEDSSVDQGGAVIETDFGQIDARIHSQLREIEEKILELIPIKSEGEG